MIVPLTLVELYIKLYYINFLLYVVLLPRGCSLLLLQYPWPMVISECSVFELNSN